MPSIAVLTGDLIASTRAGPGAVDRSIAALAGASAALSGWQGNGDTRFTRFRGDGWQMCLTNSATLLHGMVHLTARLRAANTGLSTRLSVAIGPYDRLGEAGLSAASGPVFALSGRNIDSLGPRDNGFVFAAPDDPLAPWKRAVLTLAWHQSNRWSPEQAEVVAWVVGPSLPTTDHLSRQLGISRQAVQARLKASGIAALQPALAAFESGGAHG